MLLVTLTPRACRAASLRAVCRVGADVRETMPDAFSMRHLLLRIACEANFRSLILDMLFIWDGIGSGEILASM